MIPARSQQGSAAVLANLRRIVHAIQAQSAAIEAAVGVTGPQLWALREVNRSVAGLPLGELARRLVLHKASAGRIVERLLARRLVQTERPANDRRFVVVRITDKGRALAERPVAGPAQASLLARLDRLPASELDVLDETLTKLVVLLGAETVEPVPFFDESVVRPKRKSKPRARSARPPSRSSRPRRGK